MTQYEPFGSYLIEGDLTQLVYQAIVD